MLGISKNHIKCEAQQVRQFIQILLNCEKKENHEEHGVCTEGTKVFSNPLVTFVLFLSPLW